MHQIHVKMHHGFTIACDAISAHEGTKKNIQNTEEIGYEKEN